MVFTWASSFPRYGHLQCIDSDIWPRKVDKTIVTGSNPRNHPRKKWLECIRNDLKVKDLKALLVQNRIAWRWVLNPTHKSRYGHDNKVVQPSDTVNNKNKIMKYISVLDYRKFI